MNYEMIKQMRQHSYLDENNVLSTPITRKPQETIEQICFWIKDYFDNNGAKNSYAVIGISGGKDSSIVAALCKKALGKEKVIGIQLPNGEQKDLNVGRELIDYLGIYGETLNIQSVMNILSHEINLIDKPFIPDMSGGAYLSSSARMRMVFLYGIVQSITDGARLANTCNLSEDYVGYFTRYGDGSGDFSPLGNLVVEEVKSIGYALGLPEYFVDKVPDDGICGKTDEESFGFTYKDLDIYLRTGKGSQYLQEKIENMHKRSLFKLYSQYPTFEYQIK